MVDAGILGPLDHVELLDGEIIEMSPEKSRHAASVDLAAEALRVAFGAGFTIRVQHPLALSESSEPEPDVAVVPGSPRDYVHGHPARALLVVEVSDTSLDYDRHRKAAAYAAAGIAEYWIVNLVEMQLEVHRRPSGGAYAERTVLDRTGQMQPSAAAVAVSVADLLP